MKDLVQHLVHPIVAQPGEVNVHMVEGETTVILEMTVHAEDQERVRGDNGRTLRAIRNVISAAAGRRKATFDLVDEHSDEDDSGDDTEE